MKQINRREFLVVGGSSLLASQFVSLGKDDEPTLVQVDVCIYGATASGIMAAVAATREGVKVIVVEPSLRGIDIRSSGTVPLPSILPRRRNIW